MKDFNIIIYKLKIKLGRVPSLSVLNPLSKIEYWTYLMQNKYIFMPSLNTVGLIAFVDILF